MSSLHDLMRQMQETDVTAASRFHNVIRAVKLAKPVVALGNEAKHDALMADFGLARFCQHIERFEVSWLLEQVTVLLRAQGEISGDHRAAPGRDRARIEAAGASPDRAAIVWPLVFSPRLQRGGRPGRPPTRR